MRYPPEGIRGVSGVTRATRFGRVSGYAKHAHEQLCLLVQIETQEGLDNLEAIATVDGVDGVFIGPVDLSAAIGYLGSPGHPEVQKVIEATIGRIKACGNVPGILTGDETLARRCIELGCLFTAVGADSGILARGSEALAAKFKAASPA